MAESVNARQMANKRGSNTMDPNSVKISIDNGLSPSAKEDSKRVTSTPAKQEQQQDLTVLCINLKELPRSGQFFVCAGGVFFFFLVYGYFQELIFRLEGFKPFGWYLTLIQFAFYSCFGVVEASIKGDRSRKIPLRTYGLIAFLTVSTMGLSNSSLGYLNYPTQVIFKCCKLIPVLIGGIIIQGKKFNLIDYMACVMMSVGLIFFTLADSSVSPDFSFYGVTLISLALCADAVIGNVQEKAMRAYGSTNSEMVLYSYSIGFLYILAGEIVTGQLMPAFVFCLKFPLQTYGYAFIFSLTGYLGVNFVLNLVKSFGALVAATVTTCRKALTIILSFMFFAKPFTSQYIWSGLIVVFAIYLNVYSKNRDNWDAKVKALYERHILGKRSVLSLSQGNIV